MGDVSMSASDQERPGKDALPLYPNNLPRQSRPLQTSAMAVISRPQSRRAVRRSS